MTKLDKIQPTHLDTSRSDELPKSSCCQDVAWAPLDDTPQDSRAELEQILKTFAKYCTTQGTPFGTMPNDEDKLRECMAAIKSSNLELLERVKSGLEDYIDEVRVGNDMAWRQVVHFDDVDTVFEAIRKEYE